jgi:hypothetical protein
VHCYFPAGVVLEYFGRSLLVATGGVLAIASLWLFQWGLLLSFSFLFMFFRLCASLISKLDLDIMLLQRLIVIDILLVLIYFVYRKKISLQQTRHNLHCS